MSNEIKTNAPIPHKEKNVNVLWGALGGAALIAGTKASGRLLGSTLPEVFPQYNYRINGLGHILDLATVAASAWVIKGVGEMAVEEPLFQPLRKAIPEIDAKHILQEGIDVKIGDKEQKIPLVGVLAGGLALGGLAIFGYETYERLRESKAIEAVGPKVEKLQEVYTMATEAKTTMEIGNQQVEVTNAQLAAKAYGDKMIAELTPTDPRAKQNFETQITRIEQAVLNAGANENTRTAMRTLTGDVFEALLDQKESVETANVLAGTSVTDLLGIISQVPGRLEKVAKSIHLGWLYKMIPLEGVISRVPETLNRFNAKTNVAGLDIDARTLVGKRSEKTVAGIKKALYDQFSGIIANEKGNDATLDMIDTVNGALGEVLKISDKKEDLNQDRLLFAAAFVRQFPQYVPEIAQFVGVLDSVQETILTSKTPEATTTPATARR